MRVARVLCGFRLRREVFDGIQVQLGVWRTHFMPGHLDVEGTVRPRATALVVPSLLLAALCFFALNLRSTRIVVWAAATRAGGTMFSVLSTLPLRLSTPR